MIRWATRSTLCRARLGERPARITVGRDSGVAVVSARSAGTGVIAGIGGTGSGSARVSGVANATCWTGSGAGGFAGAFKTANVAPPATPVPITMLQNQRKKPRKLMVRPHRCHSAATEATRRPKTLGE